LRIQILSYQSYLERHPQIQQANAKDIQEYKEIIEETGTTQHTANAGIAGLKDELAKAQRVRDHKLEYDRVAREIMKLNTRDTYNE
jgi:THO complex subunit 7